MHILVIDDNPLHRESARQTVDDGNFLHFAVGFDHANIFLEERYESNGEKGPYLDVVLCDLLLPAGNKRLSEEGMKYSGLEMPIGWSLAITAALRGAKYVAVVTDINYHDHPASAMLDPMRDKIFNLEGARALFTNDLKMVDILGTEGQCPDCGTYQGQCWSCRGTTLAKGKDWAFILQRVMTGRRPRP